MDTTEEVKTKDKPAASAPAAEAAPVTPAPTTAATATPILPQQQRQNQRYYNQGINRVFRHRGLLYWRIQQVRLIIDQSRLEDCLEPRLITTSDPMILRKEHQKKGQTLHTLCMMKPTISRRQEVT